MTQKENAKELANNAKTLVDNMELEKQKNLDRQRRLELLVRHTAVIGLDFEIGDRVKIIPLERCGIVISIWITKTGIQYETRYFDNAKVETVYFYAPELVRCA